LQVGLYDEKFKLHADYDLIYRLVKKLDLKGISMNKHHATGIFSLKGKSSRENFFIYLLEEFKIRKKNNQNTIIILIIFFIRIVYFYLMKIWIFSIILKFIKKKFKIFNYI